MTQQLIGVGGLLAEQVMFDILPTESKKVKYKFIEHQYINDKLSPFVLLEQFGHSFDRLNWNNHEKWLDCSNIEFAVRFESFVESVIFELVVEPKRHAV